MKYREKTVVIEAVQLRWDTWNELCDFAKVGKLSEGYPEGFNPDGNVNRLGLYIPTPEGLVEAHEGDYIIRGVNGEIFPCKPDSFELIYEVAE